MMQIISRIGFFQNFLDNVRTETSLDVRYLFCADNSSMINLILSQKLVIFAVKVSGKKDVLLADILFWI